MARQIARGRWVTLLDVASGTGQIALRVAAQPGMNDRVIIASDICPGMLTVAKRKPAAHPVRLGFRLLDAHQLSDIDDASIDCHAISFGMKICDRPRVLSEAYRVLRQGVATDGDRGAYDYLLRGIHDFPGAPQLAKEIAAFGFTGVWYRYLTFGIVALHVAHKPLS